MYKEKSYSKKKKKKLLTYSKFINITEKEVSYIHNLIIKKFIKFRKNMKGIYLYDYFSTVTQLYIY